MDEVVIERKGYIDRLLRLRRNGMIKVITGLRRSGKSFLLNRLYKDTLIDNGIDESRILSINLEDRSYRKYRDPDELYSLVRDFASDGRERYLFLDEVQYIGTKKDSITGLPVFADALLSLHHFDNLDIYVTGSNSKMLSSDIPTELRGRGYPIRVYPLTYSEYLPYSKEDDPISEYMTYGGLPPVVLCGNREDKADMLSTLVGTTYIRDILDRAKATNEGNGIREVMSVLASCIGSPTNPTRISNAFKSSGYSISSSTVMHYIDLLEDSFLIDRANRVNLKGLKHIASSTKYYFEDLGLRNSILNMRQLEMPHIMENLIYNELRARGFSIETGNIEKYSKDSNGKTIRKELEIDFVAERMDERVFIQSALTIEDPDKYIRETTPLLDIKSRFPCVIITRDTPYTHYDQNGIKIVNLSDFLNDRESILHY